MSLSVPAGTELQTDAEGDELAVETAGRSAPGARSCRPSAGHGGLPVLQDPQNIVDSPKSVGQTGGNCRCFAWLLVNATEIVMHVVERDCMRVALDLL